MISRQTIPPKISNREHCSLYHAIVSYFQTYIGDVLIVVNPYKKLDFYGDRVSWSTFNNVLCL